MNARGVEAVVFRDNVLLVATSPALSHTSVQLVRRQPSCPTRRWLQHPPARSRVELVVLRCGEDIHWSDPYEAVRTVYDQSPNGRRLDDAVQLHNVGREAHGILWHIVRRYDDLADVTVFMHGKRPSFGFHRRQGSAESLDASIFGFHRRRRVKDQQNRFGNHLMQNVSVHDYISANGSLIVLTACTDRALTRMSWRRGFTDMLGSRPPVPRPVDPIGAADEWLPFESSEFQDWIFDHVPDGRVKPMTFREFAEILFRGDGVNAMHDTIRNRRRANASRPLLPRVFCFVQGGQFAASREDIRRLPLENYKTVLDLLERGHEEISYYMELLYATMLGVDTRFRGPIKDLRFRRPLPLLSHMKARFARTGEGIGLA
jgi:hypothetical protein